MLNGVEWMLKYRGRRRGEHLRPRAGHEHSGATNADHSTRQIGKSSRRNLPLPAQEGFPNRRPVVSDGVTEFYERQQTIFPMVDGRAS